MMPSEQLNNTQGNQYHILENWLECRQSLIVSFSNLCMLKPFESTTTDLSDIKEKLNDFCQFLIDYICIGQFHLFEKILRSLSKQNSDKLIVNQLIKMTPQALYFNDQYAQATDISKLEKELSLLGESIALRLELEDELLSRYTYLFRYQTENKNF